MCRIGDPRYGYLLGYVHLMSPSTGLSKALRFLKFKYVGRSLIFSLVGLYAMFLPSV